MTSIQEDITKIEQNINKIEELHDVSLNSVTTEDQTAKTTRQLEALTADTTQLSNRTKKRIKGNCTDVLPSAPSLFFIAAVLHVASIADSFSHFYVELDIELANLRLASSPEIQIRRTQAASLKEKFLKTLRRYQSAESEARKKYQGRMERQYKIGKAAWSYASGSFREVELVKVDINNNVLYI